MVQCFWPTAAAAPGGLYGPGVGRLRSPGMGGHPAGSWRTGRGRQTSWDLYRTTALEPSVQARLSACTAVACWWRWEATIPGARDAGRAAGEHTRTQHVRHRNRWTVWRTWWSRALPNYEAAQADAPVARHGTQRRRVLRGPLPDRRGSVTQQQAMLRGEASLPLERGEVITQRR
jgi:hypothetical protein